VRAKMTSSTVLQPALSVVLEALEKIRDSQEKPLRVSRATLNRLFEQPPPPGAVEAGVSPARKTDVAAKAAALAQVRERVCVCMKCPHLARTRTQTVFGVGNPDGARKLRVPVPERREALKRFFVLRLNTRSTPRGLSPAHKDNTNATK